MQIWSEMEKRYREMGEWRRLPTRQPVTTGGYAQVSIVEALAAGLIADGRAERAIRVSAVSLGVSWWSVLEATGRLIDAEAATAAMEGD